LQRFPAALNGTKGRAQHLISELQRNDLAAAAIGFYNSLEAPALEKYPLLKLFQEFLRANGAVAALMSGSGSSTFAILPNKAAAEALCERVKSKFGETNWLGLVAA
jgi:4-diphosphocytidyl-2C-methyl-D-erythritol kinase